MNTILLAILISLSLTIIQAQSTCPVVSSSNSPQQRCKCGIKIDGHIYIYCARKQLKQLPKFTRSSILYDELILSGNQIERIAANSFNGLRVKRLYLDDNPIELIERNALNELANYLEELIVSVNYVNSVDAASAHIDNQIELVDTSSLQKRAQIPPTLFQNLLNLKTIKLNGLEWTTEMVAEPHYSSDLEIGTLKPNTFNRTRKLEVIHLVDCGINKVELSSLSGVETSLKELNLDSNQLTSVDDVFNELKRMKRLQLLNLSRNRIRQLRRYPSTQFDFAELSELLLDLSFNSIVGIDEYAFGYAQNGLVNALTKLNLNNNELSQFQLGFVSQLAGLRELHLDYNKIEYLPDNLFGNSRRLETLSLKGNFIASLRSEFVFAGLHFSLRRLNLASNKIQSISRRVFMQTGKLKELNLERNQLGAHFDTVTFRNAQPTMPWLGSLSDSDIQLNTELINTFEGVESELKILNLENNQLKASHLWSLVNLLNVETLKLGNNDFSGLSLKAANALNLKEASASQRLAKLFEFYRNLTYLDMQNSSIAQTPYFLGLNRTLLSFNLAQNKLCHLNANNLRKLYYKLKYLNLNANPLSCDCHLAGLRQWIDDLALLSTIELSSSFNSSADLNQFQREPAVNWKCASPKPLASKYVNRLSAQDLACGGSEQAEKCALDEDASIRSTTSTAKTSPHSTSDSAKTLLPLGDKEEIKIVEMQTSPSFWLSSPPAKPSSTSRTSTSPILDALHKQQRQQVQTSSFFSSMELKQTLLGSFIGALSVIIIVAVIVCLIKTTKRRFSATNMSLCLNDSEKDKSTTTTTTVASSNNNNNNNSPYDLGKLSLQTLCINSTGCSASSGSSSSSSSGSNATNSSCVCGILAANGGDGHVDLSKPCLFTKMDPLRLTMLSSGSNLLTANMGYAQGYNNRTSFHQNYLNCHPHLINAHQLNNNNNNNNNTSLHYLASHLPNSPGGDSSSVSSPSPYLLNDQVELGSSSEDKKVFLNSKLYQGASGNENNYDKLHQQRMSSSNCSFRPQSSAANFSKFSTLNGNSPFLSNCTSTLQFQNKCIHNQLVQKSNVGDLVCTSCNILSAANVAETTPFLILTSGDVNRLVDLSGLAESKQAAASEHLSSQHTYHEIGDILINLNNGNLKTLNRNNSLNKPAGNSLEAKTNEMYI